MNRIAIISNAAGGKSTLARALARVHRMPLLTIDYVQFKANWEPADPQMVVAAQEDILKLDRWIIDGFGPWAAIEKRFELASTIVFIDYPLWLHNSLAAQRQIDSVARTVFALGDDRRQDS